MLSLQGHEEILFLTVQRGNGARPADSGHHKTHLQQSQDYAPRSAFQTFGQVFIPRTEDAGLKHL